MNRRLFCALFLGIFSISAVDAYAGNPRAGVVVGIPDADRETILGHAENAEVGWIRVTFYWPLFQPTEGQFSPSYLAAVQDYVAKANDRGLQVFVTLEDAPRWARLCNDLNRTPEGSDCGNDNSPPHDAMYFRWQQYIMDLQAAFPTVTHWGIWNEPNSDGHFHVPGRDPLTEYRKLLASAAQVIRADNTVVAPDLANTGSGEVDFLRSLMQTHGSYIDVVSVHSYQTVIDTVGLLAQYRGIGFSQPIWLTEFSLARSGADSNQYPQAANVTGMFDAMNQGRVSGWVNAFPYHLYNADEGYQMMETTGGGIYTARWAYDCLQVVAGGFPRPWYCTSDPRY